MRPGRTVILLRSMILALDGTDTLLPTASILPARMRRVWPVRTAPESGSISLPARMAVIWAAAGTRKAQQAAASIRQRPAMANLEFPWGLVIFPPYAPVAFLGC